MEENPQTNNESPAESSVNQSPEEAKVISMEPNEADYVVHEGTPDQPAPPEDDTAPKNKVFRGEIPYQLTITPEEQWDIKYVSSITNDIASLAAAKFLMDNAVDALEKRKKHLEEECKKRDGDGKKIKKISADFKQYYKERRAKYAAAAFGIGIFLETMQDLYVDRVLNSLPPKPEEEVINTPQPEEPVEGTTEENNQNETHPHQESGSDQPTGDSSSGSQHQEERSE
jgi:hypothetical protein